MRMLDWFKNIRRKPVDKLYIREETYLSGRKEYLIILENTHYDGDTLYDIAHTPEEAKKKLKLWTEILFNETIISTKKIEI